MRYLYPLLFLLVILVSAVYTDNGFWVYGLLGLTLFMLLQKIGKGVALREMIAVYSCIIYLLMPLMGYRLYTVDNALARLWVKYMPVPQATYFGFVLPAVTAFILGMFMPSFSSSEEPDGSVNMSRVLKGTRETLKANNPWKQFMILGLFGYFFSSVINIAALAFFMYSFYLLLFTALLCIYFSPGLKYKKHLLGFIILLILYQAIQSGMFTVFVYMGVVIGSIIFIGSKIAFWKKMIMTVVAVLLILTLQVTKGTFRRQIWGADYQGSKIGLFTDMMQRNLGNYESLFDQKAFFPLYARMNQGYNTGLVMRRIPAVQDYDNGQSILLTIASAIMPRVLWQDKLQSGGAYNMKHFAGMKIAGWATNIGPVGEAYGNFGVTGGIIYMFLFGLFIRFAFFKVIKLSAKYPLLIFWIPVLFFELSYSMENDTLQALNALLKGAVFAWLAYKVAPQLFGARKKAVNNRKQTDEKSPHLRDNRPGWSLPG